MPPLVPADLMTVEFLTTHPNPTPIALPNQKKATIIVYPTIKPEAVVIPVVSCILGFPVVALLVICCLRHRAKLARERERRRTANLGTDPGAISLVRFSPMHRLGAYLAGATTKSTHTTRNERTLSRAFQSLELDTVVEERMSEPDIGDNNTDSSAEKCSIFHDDS